jgi:N-acyl amino acid synthase of PEP-CTERM/exosortase system
MQTVSVAERPPVFNADYSALLKQFDSLFSLRKADTAELIRRSFALRYQIYCLERQFEDARRHADEMETDHFDQQAVHGLLLHRATANAIGTVRLILSAGDEPPMPILEILRRENIDPCAYFPLAGAAEVSRFAITRQFAQRGPQSSDGERRKANLACLGLIQILLRLSLECGVTHWAAVMEPKLLRMLAMMGIRFTAIGSLIEHHGIRQPCFCHVPGMLEGLLREKPDNWSVITDAGRLSYTKAATAA